MNDLKLRSASLYGSAVFDCGICELVSQYSCKDGCEKIKNYLNKRDLDLSARIVQECLDIVILSSSNYKGLSIAIKDLRELRNKYKEALERIQDDII